MRRQPQGQSAIARGVIRARAYIRVSHVGKARQGVLLSDSMQLDEARRYAEYMEFAFDEEASRRSADLDVSGFRKKWRERPGLMRLFEEAKHGEFDVLIFYKISRLARNVKEALDLIEAFEKLGVAFHFVAEKIDSTSAQGRFLRNVLLSAAEMQSEDASTFLKSTCERRAREGRLQGGALPAWIERGEGGTFQTIPTQVAAIRRM
ncbi:MAG: recombinase family protein, partial [Chlorobia bacterium]|nr:recombinase family protein [Fimbriimonadaceae bacterium]